MPDLSGLHSLQHLDVSYNELTDFPTTFSSQSKLQTLALNSNHIRDLPTEAFCDSLKSVNLSDNELVDLPHMFCGCSKLKVLELANNR
ncbi:unnamed protein product [Gongylonema pulchrum]|uniref:LRRCT domain-containing protein n=1 Tax=Gongylonema pulchrum TaxID=637853 RepID=A0A183EZ09_9BILA|nr:unnamed protein product [Gongylonema pulchrum]